MNFSSLRGYGVDARLWGPWCEFEGNLDRCSYKLYKLVAPHILLSIRLGSERYQCEKVLASLAPNMQALAT